MVNNFVTWQIIILIGSCKSRRIHLNSIFLLNLKLMKWVLQLLLASMIKCLLLIKTLKLMWEILTRLIIWFIIKLILVQLKIYNSLIRITILFLEVLIISLRFLTGIQGTRFKKLKLILGILLLLLLVGIVIILFLEEMIELSKFGKISSTKVHFFYIIFI